MIGHSFSSCFGNPYMRLKTNGPDDGHSFSSSFRNLFMRNSVERLRSWRTLALEGFEASLVDRLKQLEATKPEGINWAWMEQAMEVLSAIHKDLRSFSADLQFPVTKRGTKDLVLECSKDRWQLLEICDLLHVENFYLFNSKRSIERVLRLLDFSEGLPPRDDVLLAKDTLQDLIGKTKAERKSGESKTVSLAATTILHSMNKSFHLGKKKCPSKGKLFIRAMYGVIVITLFVWSILTSALSGSDYSFGELNIPKWFLWSASFRNLQQEVHEDIKSGVSKAFVLKELEDLDASVKSVLSVVQTSCLGILEGKGKTVRVAEGLEGVAHIREGVKELRHRVEMLSNWLDSIMNQINEFFPDCNKRRFGFAKETFGNVAGPRLKRLSDNGFYYSDVLN